jgi:hypothetical protein
MEIKKKYRHRNTTTREAPFPDFKLAYRETAVLPWATLIPWKDRKKHGQVFDHYLTEY